MVLHGPARFVLDLILPIRDGQRQRERERGGGRQKESEREREKSRFTDDSFGVDGALLGEGFLPAAASSSSSSSSPSAWSAIAGHRARSFARSLVRSFTERPSSMTNSTRWPSLIEDVARRRGRPDARRDASSRDVLATFCLPLRHASHALPRDLTAVAYCRRRRVESRLVASGPRSFGASEPRNLVDA